MAAAVAPQVFMQSRPMDRAAPDAEDGRVVVHAEKCQPLILVVITSDGTRFVVPTESMTDAQRQKMSQLTERARGQGKDVSINLTNASYTVDGTTHYCLSSDPLISEMRELIRQISGQKFIVWPQFLESNRAEEKASPISRNSPRLKDLKWDKKKDLEISLTGKSADERERLTKHHEAAEKLLAKTQELLAALKNNKPAGLASQGEKQRITQIEETLNSIDTFGLYFELTHPLPNGEAHSLVAKRQAAKALIEQRSAPKKHLYLFGKQIDQEEETEYANQCVLASFNGNRAVYEHCATKMGATLTQEPSWSPFAHLARVLVEGTEAQANELIDSAVFSKLLAPLNVQDRAVLIAELKTAAQQIKQDLNP